MEHELRFNPKDWPILEYSDKAGTSFDGRCYEIQAGVVGDYRVWVQWWVKAKSAAPGIVFAKKEGQEFPEFYSPVGSGEVRKTGIMDGHGFVINTRDGSGISPSDFLGHADASTAAVEAVEAAVRVMVDNLKALEG